MEWFDPFGSIFIAIIMIPNILFALHRGDGSESNYKNKAVETVEQIGRYGCISFMVFRIPGTWSDWATTAIDAGIKSMWYRFSRREDDHCIECSADGELFSQMRVCHMWQGGGKIRFGIYACSPEDSSFRAVFTNMELTECKWLAHDGQQPDNE